VPCETPDPTVTSLPITPSSWATMQERCAYGHTLAMYSVWVAAMLVVGVLLPVCTSQWSVNHAKQFTCY
jgi:hypothetical protein